MLKYSWGSFSRIIERALLDLGVLYGGACSFVALYSKDFVEHAQVSANTLFWEHVPCTARMCGLQGDGLLGGSHRRDLIRPSMMETPWPTTWKTRYFKKIFLAVYYTTFWKKKKSARE